MWWNLNYITQWLANLLVRNFQVHDHQHSDWFQHRSYVRLMEVVRSAVKIMHSFPKESFNFYKKMRKQPKASCHKWELTDLVLWRYKWVDYHQALAPLKRRNCLDLCSNMFHIKFDFKSGRLFSTMHWEANWCESIRRKTKAARRRQDKETHSSDQQVR